MRRLWPIILILATLGMVVLMKDPPLAQVAGVSLVLPERVGGWSAERILFCQNELCAVSAREKEAGTNLICSVCSSPMSEWSLAERNMLPKGTEIGRRLFTEPGGRSLLVSVVLSGPEQKSIHRPQQCLPAQGNVIEVAKVVAVARPDAKPLKVMWLDVRSRKEAGDGEQGFFVYWFADGHRETPYHLERLFWTSFDRLTGRPVARWAYVSVYGMNRASKETTLAEVAEFIGRLQPQLHSRSLSAQRSRPTEP